MRNHRVDPDHNVKETHIVPGAIPNETTTQEQDRVKQLESENHRLRGLIDNADSILLRARWVANMLTETALAAVDGGLDKEQAGTVAWAVTEMIDDARATLDPSLTRH